MLTTLWLDELMKEKHGGEQNTVPLFAVVSQVLLSEMPPTDII